MLTIFNYCPHKSPHTLFDHGSGPPSRQYQYQTRSTPLRIPPRATHYIRVTHISEENLERYYLGTAPNEAAIEEHLLWCQGCQDKYVETEAFIETIRAALREPIGAWSGVVRQQQRLQ
jgi:hypothetical protein